MINRNKDHQAQLLADWYYQVEDGVTSIFRLTGSAEAEMRADEPIKLLEVNRDTIPTGIMPLYFDPAPASGIEYPAIVVQITPEEYEKLQARELALPNGWSISDEPMRRPDEGSV